MDTADEKNKTEQEILDRVKTGERWMIFLTAIVAGSAIFQTVQSCNNNASTAKQVDRIICAADRIGGAADRFSGSAAHINEGIGNAVIKLQAQAEKMDTARQSSETNSQKALDASIQASRLDERPWIVGNGLSLSSEPEEGKMPTVTITLRNTGKTPALNMFPASHPSISDNCLPWNETKLPAPKSIGILAPGQTGLSFATDPLTYMKLPIDAYNAGINKYCVRAKVLYTDADKIQHWSTICMSHTHGRPLDQFDYCVEGNDVDRSK